MKRKILFQKLKESKVAKEKKWLYTYTAWVLKNYDTKNYNQVLVRLNSCFLQSKGYYKDYYRNLSQEKRKEYSRLVVKRRKSKPEQLEIQKESMREMRKVHRLYKQGELSKYSTKKINDVIE